MKIKYLTYKVISILIETYITFVPFGVPSFEAVPLEFVLGVDDFGDGLLPSNNKSEQECNNDIFKQNKTNQTKMIRN